MLIKCTECGNEFSDQAEACPHCGAPNQIRIEQIRQAQEQQRIQQAQLQEKRRIYNEDTQVYNEANNTINESIVAWIAVVIITVFMWWVSSWNASDFINSLCIGLFMGSFFVIPVPIGTRISAGIGNFLVALIIQLIFGKLIANIYCWVFVVVLLFKGALYDPIKAYGIKKEYEKRIRNGFYN